MAAEPLWDKLLHPDASAILARVAHEMRQPLTVVATAARLIAFEDPKGRERAYRILQSQIVRLTRMVEDLLLVGSSGRDITVVRKTPIDLRTVLHGVADAVRPLIASRQEYFEVDLPDEPCWIEGDAVRLDQIFSNLLINAMKYTDAGGRIWLSAVSTNQDVIVSVGDTGRGIRADLLPHVFEMFATGSNHVATGLGVGLAVARHLVELHGGSIAIKSDGPGRGTVVSVTLPHLMQVA